MTTYIVPDDYPDVLSAWNACPDNNGDEVYVKQGSYILNAVAKWIPNYLPMKSNTKLRGDGLGKTIINMTTPELAEANRYEMLQSAGTVAGLSVEDIGFDMNASMPAQGGYGNIFNMRNGVGHSNITIRRCGFRNAFAAGIGLANCADSLVEDCVIDNVWTGIMFGGSNITVQRNRITNCRGDAIFPQWATINVNIDNNTIDTVGDTGIDITSPSTQGPHQHVKVRNNTLLNAGIRVTHANDVEISGNALKHFLTVSVDAGQGYPSNVWIHDNYCEDFTREGIYGNGADGIIVENNRMWSTRSGALHAVKFYSRPAIVRNNALSVPTKSGDAAVSCPAGSTITGNVHTISRNVTKQEKEN